MIKKILFLLLLLPSICFANSVGTAWFINKDGYALTAHHVISSNKNYSVIHLDRNTETKVKVIAIDKNYDLALLKIDVKTPQYLSFSREMLEPGMSLRALGYPYGKYRINPKAEPVTFVGTQKNFVRYMATFRVQKQDGVTTLACLGAGNTHPGMSGGPYIDSNGGAIGLVSGSDDVGNTDFIGKPAIISFLKRNGVEFSYNYNQRRTPVEAIKIIEIYK